MEIVLLKVNCQTILVGNATGLKIIVINNKTSFLFFVGFGKGSSEDSNIAKLIADSTEKKFNFNPFKGMLKKKHASFDFH